MRFTIVTTYIAVILITLLLMTFYTLELLRGSLYDHEYVNMFTKANIISERVSQIWDNDVLVTADRFNDTVENSLAGTSIRGVITNTTYNIMYDTNKEAGLLGKVFMRDVLKSALEGEQTKLTETNETGGKMISVAVPVERDNQIIGCVYLVQNFTTIENTVSATKTSMILFSLLTIFIIGMLSVGISYIITSPILQFRKAAREISKGNFSIRMKVSGHNEMAQMSETFNYMCEELEQTETKRRKFVSDASHELKTPMAGIKLICDSIVNTENIDMPTVREFLGDMSEEVERLTRIVDRLLALTKLDGGGERLSVSQVDLVSLIECVIKKISPLAEKKDVMVYTEISEDAKKHIVLDYDKMFEAIYNVTDNAVKYAPEGGYVHISLSNDDKNAVIKIEDNGIGVPEAERDKIFERFYRLDDSRARDTGGTGLGLAIVKEAVLMHNGEISVTSSENGGSIFTISLPYSLLEEEII